MTLFFNINAHLQIIFIFVLHFNLLYSQSFAMPVLFKGRQKTLEQTDLYRPLKKHKSGECHCGLKVIFIILFYGKCLIDTLGDRLSAAWDQEVAQRSAQNLPPRLGRVVARVFGWHLVLTGFLMFVHEFLTK